LLPGMAIVQLFRDGMIRATRRIRATLYMFGGVELLASEECWTWRVRGSWQARLWGLEDSGGPERAGSRLKKNGTYGIFWQDKSKLVVETRDQDSTRESVTSVSADADGWFR
jgi:hypothetical protein